MIWANEDEFLKVHPGGNFKCVACREERVHTKAEFKEFHTVFGFSREHGTPPPVVRVCDHKNSEVVVLADHTELQCMDCKAFKFPGGQWLHKFEAIEK